MLIHSLSPPHYSLSQGKQQEKTKAQKAASAAAGGSKGGKKKKWSKGRVREKAQNLVLFDAKTHKRLLAEVPKMKLITPSTIIERLKINGSLARAAIRDLESKGIIKPVSVHHTQWIYTRTAGDA